MKPASYWLDTAPTFTGAAEGPVEGHCDVAVIGGGFTGLTAALTLAKLGISVRLLEAGKVASEASGSNGGHCNNGLAHDFSATAAAHGLDRAREMYRAFDAGVDRVAAIVREEGIDCHFVRSGKLKLAAKPAHFDSMRRAQEVLAREVDDDTAIVEPGDLGAEVGTQAYHGGLLYRRSAMLHVGKFGKGLAVAAVRAGAVIHEDAPVTAIDEVAGGYRLTTARARSPPKGSSWPLAPARSGRSDGFAAASSLSAASSSSPSRSARTVPAPSCRATAPAPRRRTSATTSA